MNTLHIKPAEGISPLYLGMTQEEVLDVLRNCRELQSISAQELQISKDYGFETYRYMTDSYFFMVTYKDGKAVEIGVDALLRSHMQILLDGLDIFRMQVQEVLDHCKRKSAYEIDGVDEENSTGFDFTEIGIRLWREWGEDRFSIVSVK